MGLFLLIPYDWLEISGQNYNLSACFGLNCVSWNSYVDTLIPSVTIFGDGSFKEVIKAKWGSWCGSSSNRTGILIGRGRDTRALSPHTRERPQQDSGHWQTEEGALCRDLLWPQTSSLQHHENINPCCLHCPVCKTLFRQPVQTHRAIFSALSITMCLILSSKPGKISKMIDFRKWDYSDMKRECPLHCSIGSRC